ncbi:hypothetical protein CVT26_012795 [Gymnopilus dilepis]|uniref:F-box domain-containing protein n=1 Tax=Gymnopilus dilepis TaxID=231916 RepID=A0A409WXY7_9AGAR|nr:hypothetical protein CVT26_012795 [Gymnopilus dilepis]
MEASFTWYKSPPPTRSPSPSSSIGSDDSESPAQNLSKSIIRRIFANIYIAPNRHATYSCEASGWEMVPALTLYIGAQVCRSWRETLLASPALWARCMDLHVLFTCPILWQAIMPRIEKSSCKLHVQVLFILDPEMVEHAKQFLAAYWDRIQVLCVVYGNRENAEPSETIDYTDEDVWDVFKRPAPSLEFFSADNPFFIDLDSINEFPLFANSAPLLRYFGGTIFKIDTQAPWLSHIRTLFFTCPFLARELLDMLSGMPLLEALGICDNGLDDAELANVPHFGTVSLPQIILPKLAYISVHLENSSSSFTNYLEVLDHLTPSQKGCMLVFRSNDKLDIKPTDLDPARRIVHTYLKRSLQVEECNPVQAIMVFLSDTSVKLVCPDGRALAVERASELVPWDLNGKREKSARIEIEPRMAFRFEMDSATDVPSAAEFLDELPELHGLKEVKDLVALIYPAAVYADQAFKVAASMIISSAAVLETLDTTTDVLGHVLFMPRSDLSLPLFPCLKKLCISRSSNSKAALDVSVLRAFFEHMEPRFKSSKFGARHFHLDLNMSGKMLKGCDLTFLDQPEFEGMQVTWDQWDLRGLSTEGYWREARHTCAGIKAENGDLDFSVLRIDRAN